MASRWPAGVSRWSAGGQQGQGQGGVGAGARQTQGQGLWVAGVGQVVSRKSVGGQQAVSRC